MKEARSLIVSRNQSFSLNNSSVYYCFAFGIVMLAALWKMFVAVCCCAFIVFPAVPRLDGIKKFDVRIIACRVYVSLLLAVSANTFIACVLKLSHLIAFTCTEVVLQKNFHARYCKGILLFVGCDEIFIGKP